MVSKRITATSAIPPEVVSNWLWTQSTPSRAVITAIGVSTVANAVSEKPIAEIRRLIRSVSEPETAEIPSSM